MKCLEFFVFKIWLLCSIISADLLMEELK